MGSDLVLGEGYNNWLKDLKKRVQSAQIKASLSVNQELIQLYWDLGSSISNKLQEEKWGNSVVERVSTDLKKGFPNLKGFSRSNLFYMKKFFEFYQGTGLIQQLVGQIPWGHNIVIFSKASNTQEAKFYLLKTIENNWSRAVLVHQIELNLFERSGKAINNFKRTLPPLNSELAQETLKDPYKFDFLELREKALEKDLEDQLTKHITEFLLELGAGFAFVGRQVPIEIDGESFYLDLLFYHIKLKCYVVIDLKVVKFKAEYAGKMNLYLSAVDDQLREGGDQPSIGIILCKSRSKVIAEYALRGSSQPIGVAEYELIKAVPEDLKPSLPSIEQLEEAIQKDIQGGEKTKSASSSEGDKAIDFVEAQVRQYVEAVRPEPAIRPQLDLGYSWENNVLILFEIRPDWMDPEIIRNHPFAKAKYVKSRDVWKLYWMRASGKWESYPPNPEVPRLDQVLEIIDQDEHHCFKG